MTTEKHVRYSQDVDTLAAAWYFIMRHCDEFAAPSIAIEAYSEIVQDVDGTYSEGRTAFTASIHGTVDA